MVQGREVPRRGVQVQQKKSQHRKKHSVAPLGNDIEPGEMFRDDVGMGIEEDESQALLP